VAAELSLPQALAATFWAQTADMVDKDDLKAVLSLLKAYANKEKAGAHFKDDEQRLPDGYYVVRIARLEAALAKAS
jgi:hypothetical protein